MIVRPLRLACALALSGAALALPAPAALADGVGLRTRLQPHPLGAAPGAAALPVLPWHDRVLAGPAAKRATVRATTANPPHYYRIRSGQLVRVTLSAQYPDQPAVPRSYVDFLDGMPHGAELGRLSIYIAPQDEVQRDCGGDPTVLACYTPQGHEMFVPGDETASYGGVTTRFVVAHEYGHHIAAFRRNDPFDQIYRRWGGTVAFGPKYWSSEKRVCAGAERRYFPGDEGDGYPENPGEAWAETYAHLTYSGVPWMFDPALAPTRASLAAARRDVLHPWTRYRHRTFTGRLGPGRARRTVHFGLRLDGRLALRLHGPAQSDYDLALRSGPNHDVTGRGRDDGSHDVIRYAEACRVGPVARVAVTVHRRHGRGPFRLALTYAG